MEQKVVLRFIRDGGLESFIPEEILRERQTNYQKGSYDLVSWITSSLEDRERRKATNLKKGIYYKEDRKDVLEKKSETFNYEKLSALRILVHQ